MTEIKRPNYFTSQFLVEGDFNDEQAYHLKFRRRHNRVSHTFGVADGLGVSAVTGALPPTVQIAAGTAIDKDGNEIVLNDPTTHQLSTTSPGANVYLVARYHDALDEADRYAPAREHFTRTTERPSFEDGTATPPTDGSVVVLALIHLNGSSAIQAIDTSVRTLASAVLAPGSVTATQLAPGAVLTANIGDGQTTGGKIAVGTVTGTVPGTAATSGNIAKNTITGGAAGNVALGTITGGTSGGTGGASGGTATGNIAIGTITGGLVGTAATIGNIANGTITSANIANGTITGGLPGTAGGTGNIANGTITSANIATGTITGGTPGTTASAGNIAKGTITGGTDTNGATGNIAAGTVTLGNLAQLAGTANQMSGTGHIDAGTLNPTFTITPFTENDPSATHFHLMFSAVVTSTGGGEIKWEEHMKFATSVTPKVRTRTIVVTNITTGQNVDFSYKVVLIPM